MFDTAPVLEAPPAVVEYGQSAPRCGVRGARTRGHVRTAAPVVVYVTPALPVASTASVITMTAAPTVFPTAAVPIATA